MAERPKSVDEYKRWLRDEHNATLKRAESHYDSVVRKIHADVLASDAWTALNDNLVTMNQRYLVKTGYPLFVTQNGLRLYRKSFDSFLVKTFRKNVLNNAEWPDPPPNGWLLPENWFTRINDIVRTLLVVKYLDGVTFAAAEIVQLFESNQRDCEAHFEARTEGYYAAHLYASFPVTIPRVDWDTQGVIVPLELQITTQVQEVIRRLLHAYYEERRVTITSEESESWQWDYKSPEFSANYLGHVLHYVEGMIVEIRDRQEPQIR
ncbi:MAG: hypothetical protein OXJ63_01290 [Gammaproteobacteria bacterium]|nr:hypothetical protein [Gammaproteobacteria bacterium]